MTDRADRGPSLSRVDVALRPATPEDCWPIWHLRNDPDTRRASFDSAEIPREVHERWFRDSLVRPDRRIYMIAAGEESTAGVARLDMAGRDASVGIYLAAHCRGHGLGPAVLTLLAGLARQELGLGRLLAFVKPDNLPSLSAFKKAGFVVQQEAPERFASEGGAAVSLVKALSA